MAYEYTTPRYALKYDKEKCGNAYECLKCVEASVKVGCFAIGWCQSKTPEPPYPQSYEEIDHMIITCGMAVCNGCGKCIEACPKDALTLVKPEPRVPAAKVQRSDIIFCYTLKDGTKVTPRG